MKTRLSWLGGVGIGATIMYLFDPDRGRRRRSIAGDQVRHQAHRAGHALRMAGKDLFYRGKGVLSQAMYALMRHSDRTGDAVLVARVRSRLGRLVAHPHAIEVIAQQGRIILRGLILENEMGKTLSALTRVLGVSTIESQLKVHREENHVPALEGGRRERGRLAQPWPPGVRILVGGGATLPVLLGLRAKNPRAYVLAGVGFWLFLRALTNQSVKNLLGLGADGMIRVHKQIHIEALPENVFDFWSDFDNFAQFLPEVIEVRALGPRHSRWVISGPAGIPVRWNAVTTEFEPGRVIAWRSEPGALIKNSGRIQFVPVGSQGSKIVMDLSYRPLGGKLGHSIALAFGADPKSQLDDALLRVKGLLERGPSERLRRFAAGF